MFISRMLEKIGFSFFHTWLSAPSLFEIGPLSYHTEMAGGKGGMIAGESCSNQLISITVDISECDKHTVV